MTTISEQRRYRQRLLRQIGKTSAIPNRGDIANAKLEREKERYLLSKAVQCAVLYDIWRDELDFVETQQRWELAQASPFLPYDFRAFRAPPVSFFHIPRSTSGLRKICRFDHLEKMWHILAKDLIVAQHRPRPHIGDWTQRGRDFQIDQILAVLRSSRQAIVCADIKRAFASVNIDAVYDLHYLLPEPLIRRAIDYRSHTFSRRERSEYVRKVDLAIRSDGDEVENAPSGLMEGSCVSNAIFSVLMDGLPSHLDEDIHVFVYCDNIILIAPTMSRALRAQDALVRYLSEHRAGPFDVRSAVTSASLQFEHLGYSISRRSRSKPEVGLSLSGWRKFGARLQADPFDLDGMIRWMLTSYSRCSEKVKGELVQMVIDELTYRDQARNAA